MPRRLQPHRPRQHPGRMYGALQGRVQGRRLRRGLTVLRRLPRWRLQHDSRVHRPDEWVRLRIDRWRVCHTVRSTRRTRLHGHGHLQQLLRIRIVVQPGRPRNMHARFPGNGMLGGVYVLLEGCQLRCRPAAPFRPATNCARRVLEVKFKPVCKSIPTTSLIGPCFRPFRPSSIVRHHSRRAPAAVSVRRGPPR